MNLDHGFMVLLAKSFGLICFVVASALVLIYALRPSARKRFERAGKSIIDDGDDLPARTGSTSDEHEGGTDERR